MVLFINVMFVFRHGHPGIKKVALLFDQDTPVKPEYDNKEGLFDLDYRVKPEYDNKEGCLIWIIGSSPIMT